MDFNYFDIAVIAILSLFAVRGMLRGFVKEIFSLIGLVGSIWAAYHYYPLVATYLTFFENEMWRNVAAYFIIFAAGMIVINVFIVLTQGVLSLSFLSWLDKLLGFGFGLCKGLLICSIIVTIAQGFFNDTSMIKEALTMPYLNMLIEYVRTHIPQDLFNLFSNKA